MRLTLTHVARAVTLCALAATYAANAQHIHSAPAANAAAGPVTVAAAPAPALSAASPTVHRFVLHTNIVDGKMVYVNDKGQVNPTLNARVGDTVEVVLDSGEGAEHDFVISELNVASAKFNSTTGKTTVRFKVTQPGDFTYFCSIPGHRQIGMAGTLSVTGEAVPQAASGAQASSQAASTNA